MKLKSGERIHLLRSVPTHRNIGLQFIYNNHCVENTRNTKNAEVTVYPKWILCHIFMDTYSKLPTMQNNCRGGAVGISVRLQGWVFEFQPRQTEFFKTGSDSSTANAQQ